jgi:hypothetical protein
VSKLHVADLRFTGDEAAAFLGQVMGLDLSAEDAAALETCTEGWIMGLRMATLSMQGSADTHEFLYPPRRCVLSASSRPRTCGSPAPGSSEDCRVA